MPKGYRLLIVAVAGLAVLAASPPKNAGSQPSDGASEKVERSLEDIAATLKKSQEPSQHEKPCPEGDNDRSSDLCAQWKAADAAKSASQAAWWIGCIGTLIGALTLAAAWNAAKWARKAAEHTETGAIEARRAANAAETGLEQSKDVSHADLRAWTSVDLTLKGINRTDNFVIVSINAALKNIGKTPALRVSVSLDVRIVPSLVTNNGELPALNKRQNQLSSLLPSAAIEYAEGIRIDIADVQTALANCKSVGFPPMIVVDAVAFYHTVFDAEDTPKRLTSTRYFLAGKATPGLTVRTAQWEWLNRPDPLRRFDPAFSHDKSAPVYLT